MSTDSNTNTNEGTAGDTVAEQEAADATRTEIDLEYEAPSQVVAEEGHTTVALCGNVHRPPVAANGAVDDPLAFREALSALYNVVASDFRYKPKDRTQYLAYLRMKRESAGQDLWQAQQAYFSWLARNDPNAFFVLDPIVTVHPDELIFEVFSKDEGTYAKLGFHEGAVRYEGEPTFGTTNIDFSDALFAGVQRMRSYRDTSISVARRAVGVATEDVGEVIEKKINVPDTWLRGFLQVQSAAMLPADHFELAPMDLYNALRHLRLHADQKGKRRGLRVELVPGEQPRLVLEPWEVVIEATGAAYTGRQAKVVRVWGRRRLMLARRVLSRVDKIDVHLLGSGLPSFWVLRGEGFDLTLGLSGFTASNWSQALAFDLLLPRTSETTAELEKVVAHLADAWCGTARSIAEATGLKGPQLSAALQLGCQHGRLMYDIARDVYRLRPLTDAPIDLERLEFRNDRERVAHDLLARKGAVTIETENRIFGTGTELTGKVAVKEDKRDYRPQILIDEDGYMRRAECTCTFYRKNGLKQGPCAHLMALLLLHRIQEAEKLQGVGGRKTVTVETRTFSRRREGVETVYQLTLNKERVKVRWGARGGRMRVQNLFFNSVDEAREAFFGRVDDLETKGYLDATAG